MKNILQSQKGIGLIEILVGLSIITIAFLSFLVLAQYSLRAQEYSKSKLEAISLASEVIEATQSVRDENWNNIVSLSLETQYYPVISDNKWTLTTINPGPISEIYNRWVILEKVYRDANDDISSSGTEDIQTRKVTTFVEWDDHGNIKQISLVTYLTNWQ